MNDFLKQTAKAMDDKQAEDIVMIDFRQQSPFVDYFLIATARNERMAKAIIENVEDMSLKLDHEVLHIYDQGDSGWFLIDLGEIVCHVFCNGQREAYNLEGLWKDLPSTKM